MVSIKSVKLIVLNVSQPNWTTITEVQEINKSIEEDEYGVTLVQHYKPIVNADFCAPDTLDIAGGCKALIIIILSPLFALLCHC